MRILFIFAVFCLNLPNSHAQTNRIISITFHPMYGNESFKTAGQYYTPSGSDSISIETCKFYVSAIKFLKDDSLVWSERNSYHLINAFDINTLSLRVESTSKIVFDQLRFNVGIDSTTNESGALGGDLDPTRGMYWTWQNGYINFKLEGTSNLCNTRNHEFQFHLGGYQYPYNSLQQVHLISKNKDIHLNVNLGKMIYGTDLRNMNHVMSPGKDAMRLSEKIPTLFSISDR